MESFDNDAEGWDDVEEDPAFVSKVSETAFNNEKQYAIWTPDEIEGRQKNVIEEAIELLGLNEDDAITSLKHFNWNPEKLQENWFNNEEKTREICGLTPLKFLVSRNMNKQDLCYICYEKLEKDK